MLQRAPIFPISGHMPGANALAYDREAILLTHAQSPDWRAVARFERVARMLDWLETSARLRSEAA